MLSSRERKLSRLNKAISSSCRTSLTQLFIQFLLYLTQLGIDASGGNSHHYRLHRPDLFSRNPLLCSLRQVIFHAGNASYRHSGRQMEKECCLWFENSVVAGDIVKISECLLLLFR